jgi:hypothetical protein
MKLFDESKFKTKKELIKFLVDNHDSLIKMKMETFKKGEAIAFNGSINYVRTDNKQFKANEPIQEPGTKINVLAVINSTNWLDSHQDVHIPGLWKKSISENRFIKHLQEHEMQFSKIISDKSDLKVYTKDVSWKDLGFNYSGMSECLIFDSMVKQSRNEFMFEQYANGHVDNHSVGMRYMKIVMCINDEGAGANFEAWEKYYPMIINPENADSRGYFWAVTEAKVIEGSAVPIGSNIATPTLENNKSEPFYNTQEPKPSKDTSIIDYQFLINNL